METIAGAAALFLIYFAYRLAKRTIDRILGGDTVTADAQDIMDAYRDGYRNGRADGYDIGVAEAEEFQRHYLANSLTASDDTRECGHDWKEDCRCMTHRDYANTRDGINWPVDHAEGE